MMFTITITTGIIGIIQGTIHCYYNGQSETEEKEPWTIYEFWTGNFTFKKLII